MKAFIVKLVFVAGLCTGLAMALAPNLYGAPHRFLPAFLRKWVNEHDDLANMAAFFLLATAGLHMGHLRMKGGRIMSAPEVKPPRRSLGRVAAFMVLVCVIEFIQNFIPGRVADLEDVCTGWSGIFAAWLLCELRDSRATQS